MKTFVTLSAVLACASAAAVSSPKVSYDGYKVARVSVGDSPETVKNIISKLDLTTWKDAHGAGSYADVLVSPSQWSAFEKETSGLDATIMHEDLGKSIAEESTFTTYAGTSDGWT